MRLTQPLSLHLSTEIKGFLELALLREISNSATPCEWIWKSQMVKDIMDILINSSMVVTSRQEDLTN